MMKTHGEDTHLLLKRVSADDGDAFRFFYNLYYKDVFRYAYYFLGNKESCREVVSNIFFSIWQSRSSLTKVDNLESYLFIVSRNESSRYRRQQYLEEAVSLDELTFSLEHAAPDSPENDLLYNEMNSTLSDIIQNLPDRCRMVFILSRLEGLEYGQIAQRMNLTESTVRVQMKIAIDKIMVALRKYYPHLTLAAFFDFISFF